MKKIDTATWEEFSLGALFDIVKGTRLTKADMKNGEINYIGATAFNNGVTAKIANTEHLHPAGTLTVCYNGSIGQTFYQTEPFWATDDVNVLYPKFKMTPNIARFLCAVIYKISLRYAYVDKWTVEKMITSTIKLPSTNKHIPNWAYMEEYMSAIEQKVNSDINLILNALGGEPSVKIDTASWHKFKIGSILPNIIKPQVYHTYQVHQNESGIPYVVRSKFDNGVKYRVSKLSLQTSPAGVISFGAENSAFFYQEEEWCSGRDIYYIDTRDLSPHACRFLLTCLQKISSKYSYNYGLFPDILKEEFITLPATDACEPDWNYMDEYMRLIEQKVKDSFHSLSLQAS